VVRWGGQIGERRAGGIPGPFFTIVNYEQMLGDSLDVNQGLRPDVVMLDEAQRVKNWSAKTTQAVKRLQSRYAFILTGTPIENRIDELFSIMGFLEPAVLGSLFRFNREFYELDDRGRPIGYRNLDKLLRHLNMLRMVCDTNYILNPEKRDCPKLAELEPNS
jgi:hypothetical protein